MLSTPFERRKTNPKKKKKKANRNDPETHTYLKNEENQDLWREKGRKKERNPRKQGRKQTSNLLNGVCLEPRHKQYCKQTNPKPTKLRPEKKTYKQTHKTNYYNCFIAIVQRLKKWTSKQHIK
jgi:hypothetical protein